jgi:protein arginine kinase
LSQAHVIASKETMNQLSLLRLGVDLGMFEGISKAVVDELFLISQPWHLQVSRPEKLDAEQRDALRAEMLRQRMKQFPAPDHTKAVAPKPV